MAVDPATPDNENLLSGRPGGGIITVKVLIGRPMAAMNGAYCQVAFNRVIFPVAAGFTVKTHAELHSKSNLLWPQVKACGCTGETPVLLNLSFLFFQQDLACILLIIQTN